jgi:hypothetical protein
MVTMPHDLIIPAIRTAPNPPDTKRAANAPAATMPASPPEVLANPALRLDASLGLVVIEFRDGAGTITHSIPSQRQMEAYRTHQDTPPSPGSPDP